MKKKKLFNYSIFRRLIDYAKPYKSLVFLSFISTISLSLLSPLRPAIIGYMVDSFIVKEHNNTALLNWSLIVAAILVVEGILFFSRAYWSNLLAQNIIKDIRTRLFQKITSFKMRYFDKTPVGALVTRVVSDLEAVTDVFSSGLIEIIGNLISLTFILTLMFFANWQLSLMTLIPIPILLITTRLFARAMKNSFKMERKQVTRLNTFVQERINGMGLVQIFNRQQKEALQFKEINKKHRQAHLNAVWANSIFFPAVELLSSLSIAFLLIWGALMVEGKTNHDIKLMYGQIIAFTLWIYQLYRPIRMLADKFNILQRGMVRAERIFEIINLENNIQDNGTVKNANFDDKISFDNVSFAYKDSDYVIKNLSFSIKAGEMVAFVGATGAGKTTIVNLMARFYDYTHGEILIGQTPIKKIPLKHLRRNISIVLQDVFLFSDSIHNNITLGNKSISREKVIEASKAVGAFEFINSLPGGFDFKVGERGTVLSVGQRQLLSFIRAYLYNPHILILDEATSSIDSESEILIQHATAKLTKGRTSIVIAHRLSTIKSADKIIVLEHGEIKEIGSHKELIQKERSYYRKLYDKQFAL